MKKLRFVFLNKVKRKKIVYHYLYQLQSAQKSLLTYSGQYVTSDNLTLLSANPTKWSNKFEQFVGKLPANYLSVFHHFVGLALKGLKQF